MKNTIAGLNMAFDPDTWLALTEVPRAGLELSALMATAPFLSTLPTGDGHPVVVLPGFLASDDSTWILRKFLASKGYDVRPWQFGRNLGAMKMGGYEALVQSILRIYRETNKPVSLVGWSLGGVHAVAVAHRAGYAVRRVLTLGSPLIGGRNPNDSRAMFNALGRVAQSINAKPIDTPTAKWQNLLLQLNDDIPLTSIYSRTDGVVSWQRSHLAERAQWENIQLTSSHIGLGVNPAVFFAIADRLGQPEHAHTPFDKTGWRAALFK